MHSRDLRKRIDDYQRQVREAYKIGPNYYGSVLKSILHQIVKDLNTGIYTNTEAQEVWRSVLPNVGAEEYGGISESFEKSGSYNISFDSADQLADMLSAYRRNNR
ncbi:hypothetical protein DFO54_11360 [Erwinia sp. AG740]|nr:hypothetical protein DFO54_11360 [Erwinia sp. AG740]